MAHHQGMLQALTKLPQHGRHVVIDNRTLDVGLPNASRAKMVPSCVLDAVCRVAAYETWSC